ncbi:putative E3 ubiquitin ligase [Handroanthus impetiginosus]|uniref:Putative E3 ubiquitin ligase n=1 Tax=Handroanthus impetiginosus TaxID=429701 RepID=A0A2G9H4P0_9LAMI|nr:putative E3 ubiquitin ligase [Handroanthus impetiginosus]
MAVQAENLCFESLDFGSFAACGYVLGIENGFCPTHLDSCDEMASSSSFSFSGSLPVEFLYSDFQKQSLEMDLFLQLQNQRLRSILQEETRKQTVLLQKYESRIQSLILQKDDELTLARNRTMELQNFLKRAEMEAKIWKKKAAENEAIVCDLNNRLNRVREKDDAVSFCDSSSSKRGKRIEENREKMACKLCQCRNSCVVFFPCRHLCCCKSCESVSGQCPVCETVKETSLEVFLV